MHTRIFLILTLLLFPPFVYGHGNFLPIIILCCLGFGLIATFTANIVKIAILLCLKIKFYFILVFGIMILEIAMMIGFIFIPEYLSRNYGNSEFFYFHLYGLFFMAINFLPNFFLFKSKQSGDKKISLLCKVLYTLLFSVISFIIFRVVLLLGKG